MEVRKQAKLTLLQWELHQLLLCSVLGCLCQEVRCVHVQEREGRRGDSSYLAKTPLAFIVWPHQAHNWYTSVLFRAITSNCRNAGYLEYQTYEVAVLRSSQITCLKIELTLLENWTCSVCNAHFLSQVNYYIHSSCWFVQSLEWAVVWVYLPLLGWWWSSSQRQPVGSFCGYVLRVYKVAKEAAKNYSSHQPWKEVRLWKFGGNNSLGKQALADIDHPLNISRPVQLFC